MKKVEQKYLSGERALFQSAGIAIKDSVFADGESPLKESKDIDINASVFKWKYPLWYCDNVKVKNSHFLETARSGIWYTNHIEITDSSIDAPKNFRRGKHIKLENVHMANALETLWNCNDIRLKNVHAKGDYFGMNSNKIYIDHLNLTGNYSFDGAKDVEVHHSTLISKDAFWNCENVVIYDSTIVGEYLGWNSKNVTFINCTIESLQGLCYIENLKMVNCKLINTTLAFEFSTVDATITTHINSIMNPLSGIIRAQSIGELIMDKVDQTLTQIIVENEVVINAMEDPVVCVC